MVLMPLRAGELVVVGEISGVGFGSFVSFGTKKGCVFDFEVDKLVCTDMGLYFDIGVHLM